MNQLKQAWKTAKRIHNGQYRFNGQPYIEHIKDCIRLLDEMGLTTERRELLTILHDVLEDGGKGEDVSFLKFSDFNDLRLLTHKGGLATYDKYIEEIISKGSKDVIIVKVVDMIQNLTEDPKKKQRLKYRVAFPKLMKALIEHIKG